MRMQFARVPPMSMTRSLARSVAASLSSLARSVVFDAGQTARLSYKYRGQVWATSEDRPKRRRRVVVVFFAGLLDERFSGAWSG